MMSGIVGNNTHRALNVDEFRAFAMADKWAPLIFINTIDSSGAKLFSVLHEVTHIWMGRNDFFNDRQGQTIGISDIEVVCNAVAAEMLVPQEAFQGQWEKYDIDIFEKITMLAKYFWCGEIVIARRALDCKKIEKYVYDQVVQSATEKFKQVMKENRQAKGGDYYNTMGSRLDGRFVRALCESINKSF